MRKTKVKLIENLAKKEKKVIVSHTLEASLSKRFNIYCAENGLNKSYIVRELLNDYLKNK